jgi:hypothetical protein
MTTLAAYTLPADATYLIGHNIDFDWGAIGQPDIKRICTLALSRKVWPTLDSHSQSAGFFYVSKSCVMLTLVLYGSAHTLKKRTITIPTHPYPSLCSARH